jgi:hypothetical protein
VGIKVNHPLPTGSSTFPSSFLSIPLPIVPDLSIHASPNISNTYYLLLHPNWIRAFPKLHSNTSKMKSFALIAVLAASVAAQSVEDLVGQLPECALPCIQSSSEAAGCKQGDFACECENQEAISVAAAECQMKLGEAERCSATDLASTFHVTTLPLTSFLDTHGENP